MGCGPMWRTSQCPSRLDFGAFGFPASSVLAAAHARAQTRSRAIVGACCLIAEGVCLHTGGGGDFGAQSIWHKE